MGGPDMAVMGLGGLSMARMRKRNLVDLRDENTLIILKLMILILKKKLNRDNFISRKK
jgi:hypothetical protein